MNIKIDTHEFKRIDSAKYYYGTCKVEVTPLEYGDFIFDDQVVYEYKTISDFMGSITNDSVFEEAVNQAQHYPYHYVIIEGDIHEFLNSHWRFYKKYRKYIGMYNGAIRRLRTFTNVIVCRDELDALNEMLLQANKCLNQKVYGGVKRSIKTGDILTHVLCGVGGVSSKKAETIIKTLELTNINDLINCSVEDFTTVKGIGKKTANNIHDFIHLERTS